MLIEIFIFLSLGIYMTLVFLYVYNKSQRKNLDNLILDNLDNIIARGIGNTILAKRKTKEAQSMNKNQEPGRKIIPPIVLRPHIEKKKDMKIFKSERKKNPQTTQEPKKRRTSLKDMKNIA